MRTTGWGVAGWSGHRPRVAGWPGGCGQVGVARWPGGQVTGCPGSWVAGCSCPARPAKNELFLALLCPPPPSASPFLSIAYPIPKKMLENHIICF